MKFSASAQRVIAAATPVAFFVVFAAWAPISTASADAVRKLNNQRIAGTVTAITPYDVTVDVQGTPQKLPVNEVDAVEFDGEPAEIKLVRSAFKNGGDQNVLVQLQKINPASLTKKELKQDYDFYAAAAKARLALRGAGAVKEAGGLMYTFVTTHPDSYHLLQAQEMLGELFVADGNVAQALVTYGELEKAPYDEFKMRAGTARGRAYMAQQKYPEALAEFEKVLALPFNPMTQKGTPSESQRFAAVLGRAQCQAGTGKYDEAIKELEENVIANLNPEETALQALAYVTLGNCYNAKPDGKKAALLAFLHVDVLYGSVGPAHAEALWNLSNLWTDIGKNERGQECLNRLNRQYPGSPWLTKKRS